MDSLKNRSSSRARGVTMVEYALLISVMAIGAGIGFRCVGAGALVSVLRAQAPLNADVRDTVLIEVPRARDRARDRAEGP